MCNSCRAEQFESDVSMSVSIVYIYCRRSQ